MDDLPVHGAAFTGIDRLAIARRLVTVLQAHHVPAVYGFVNGKKTDDDPSTLAVLRLWLAAGYPLGNHTYSHISLNETPVAEYVADLDKGEAVLRALEPGAAETRWKFFRYPFLFEGNTLEKREAVREHLKAAGYRVAEVSIDGDDWAWNPAFARCMDRRNAPALTELRHGLVKTHVDELRYMRDVTRQLAGRDVKHVLLLHLGAAEADAIDDLLTAYEHEGVRWIGLETALDDPFYSIDTKLPWKAGAAFPYAVAKSRGVKLPEAPEREAEEKLEATCR